MNRNLRNVFVVLIVLFSAHVGFGQTLTGIESVEFDAVNHRFLVSNGNNVIQVDSNGDPVAVFGTDPAADFGMEIMGTALYTIVGSDVRAYDLTSGLQVSSITITNAQFLNGMASDGDHRIWVSDFNGKKIYEIDFSNWSSPSFVEVVSNTVTTPNGICYDEVNNRLVFVNWGTGAKIKSVSLADYSVTTLVSNSGVGNIDGIDNDNYGNYFISSWTPNRITKYNSDFSVNEIITVADGLGSPADIAYAEEIDTLIIPNTSGNTVRFVGFTASRVEANESNPFGFSCYPNPVNDKTVISFALTKSAVTTIEVLDSQGRLVETILVENLAVAKHKVIPGELDLAPGNYLWHIISGDVSFTQPFMK